MHTLKARRLNKGDFCFLCTRYLTLGRTNWSGGEVSSTSWLAGYNLPRRWSPVPLIVVLVVSVHLKVSIHTENERIFFVSSGEKYPVVESAASDQFGGISCRLITRIWFMIPVGAENTGNFK